MKAEGSTSTGRALLVLGVLLALWGVVGFVMAPGFGETGFFYGPDFLVREVEEGSSAEAAGIQEGDRVVSVDGVPVEDLPMQSRWQPRAPGAAAVVMAEREGEALTFQVAFVSAPVERRVRSTRSLIVALAFLGFGLWAYLSVKTPLALVLAGIGLTRAAASFPGPDLGPRFEGYAASVQFMAIVALAFLFLRFFLEVPRPRRILQSGTLQKVLWGGMLLSGLVCLAELALHPALYIISGIFLAVLILPVYLLLFVLVPVSWLRANATERQETGLGLMLMGLLLGIGPVILLAILEGIFGLTIPGSAFIPVPEVAVPLFLALGVARHAANHRVGRAGG